MLMELPSEAARSVLKRFRAERSSVMVGVDGVLPSKTVRFVPKCSKVERSSSMVDIDGVAE